MKTLVRFILIPALAFLLGDCDKNDPVTPDPVVPDPTFPTQAITWEAVSLPSLHLPSIRSIALAADDGLLISFVDHGVYLSTDHGTTWSATLATTNAYDLIPTQTGILALRAGEGWKSTDGGKTWAQLTTNPPQVESVNSPSRGSKEFVSSPNGQIIVGYQEPVFFHSSNGGDSWETTTIDYNLRKEYDGYPIVSNISVSNMGDVYSREWSSLPPNHVPDVLTKFNVSETTTTLPSIQSNSSSPSDHLIIDYDPYDDTMCYAEAMVKSSSRDAGSPSLQYVFGNWFFAVPTTEHPTQIDPKQFNVTQPTYARGYGGLGIVFGCVANRKYVYLFTGSDIYLSNDLDGHFERSSLVDLPVVAWSTQMVMDVTGRTYFRLNNRVFRSTGPISF